MYHNFKMAVTFRGSFKVHSRIHNFCNMFRLEELDLKNIFVI